MDEKQSIEEYIIAGNVAREAIDKNKILFVSKLIVEVLKNKKS